MIIQHKYLFIILHLIQKKMNTLMNTFNQESNVNMFIIKYLVSFNVMKFLNLINSALD